MNRFRSLSSRPARIVLAAASTLALGLGVVACGGSSSSGGEINLVAYSVVETVYDESLIPGFQKTSEGDGATFKNSFGPSGDQQRAVIAGQPADYVHLSIEPDMQALVDAGIVDSGWQDNQYKGIVQDSVVVFAVRKGNPKNIQTWDDVVKPGVEVVTPNVFSSGGAKWNLMAAYGAQVNQGKSPDEALAFLKTLLEHAVVQPGSAGDALTAFTSGKGDVLLAYESDAIEAQKAGEDIDYVIPDDTILIETPAAATVDAPTQAQDFLTYLWTPEAQQLWADGGYRPVDQSVLAKNKDKFPTPPGLFDIASLGGWEKVNTEFFDPENGSVAKIESDLGVSTG
ncbi:MAG TPA: sulfate ABC transporter substrate-binding protein [Solirubrobacterales bacterium]|nr:sulfate ABC transporter substrate-binding protein [Solirubrobacterales bacterium]